MKTDKSNGYQWFFSPQKEFRQKIHNLFAKSLVQNSKAGRITR
ncbi:hypothetical protein ATORI0001_0130 [Lancefieldella rimae ATCC 49626]|uniref:Uncharacterized protein n=1 Tax=Lancefieldella rimae (strain ATCC 49626 / DSM 7090 / CCUG 31168 / NBRC 15546 / VPI D140H-11A) TaxID=553184 RepID=B9CNT0_LANR4|nr:hypothetical protein ATORI0001_0130 [Lancefieldella rimae ATCC 49626]